MANLTAQLAPCVAMLALYAVRVNKRLSRPCPDATGFGFDAHTITILATWTIFGAMSPCDCSAGPPVSNGRSATVS